MISRRALVSQVGVLGLGAAGVWFLRERLLWPPPVVGFAQGATSGWLPIPDREQHVVTVEAQLNGRSITALVDSGAQSCVVDRGLAEQLGLSTTALAPVVAYGVSGQPQLGRSATLDVQLGGMSLTGLRAAVLDLAGITRASGREFGLILGQNALRALIVDIDFPAGRIAFQGPSGYAPPPQAVQASTRLEGHELVASIFVESKPLDVVVDTGASAPLALSEETAQANGLLSGRPMRYAPSITFGGVSRDRVVRVEQISFAGVSYEDVPVQIYTPGTGIRTPKGLLGVDALNRFRVILDLGGGRLFLMPPAEEPPDPPQRRRRRRRPASD